MALKHLRSMSEHKETDGLTVPLYLSLVTQLNGINIKLHASIAHSNVKRKELGPKHDPKSKNKRQVKELMSSAET